MVGFTLHRFALGRKGYKNKRFSEKSVAALPSSQEMRVHQHWKGMWICPTHNNINRINSHTVCHFCCQSLMAPHPSDCFFKQSTLPKTICAASSHFNEKPLSRETATVLGSKNWKYRVSAASSKTVDVPAFRKLKPEGLFKKNVCTSLHCILRYSYMFFRLESFTKPASEIATHQWNLWRCRKTKKPCKTAPRHLAGGGFQKLQKQWSYQSHAPLKQFFGWSSIVSICWFPKVQFV